MKIIFALLLSITLYANIKQEMYNFYQNEKYEKACNIGFDNFKENKTNEEFLSLYAFSCLKSDYIDRLSAPIARLKYSKEARSNSAYFSVILMQKKLLLHSMIDGYTINNLNLPTTEYILSKVFDFYSKLKKHEPRSVYLFEDTNDKKLTYKLYLNKGEKVDKIVIEEFYDNTLIKKHIYW
ncbi:hypothetical protein [Sulfurimonas sp.]